MPANIVPQIVYVLCGLTSLACMILLLRGYLRSGARMLLWSTLCFASLFANNVLLYLDLVVFPSIYLSPYRTLTGVLAVVVLVGGMIWDAE